MRIRSFGVSGSVPRSTNGATRSGTSADGLIAPTALFVVLPLCGRSNQWGWHAARRCRSGSARSCSMCCCPSWTCGRSDGQNPPDEVMERLENDKYYRYCTYIYIPFQYASVIFGAYLFTASDLSWLGFDGGLSWGRKIGLALSVGMLGGVASTPPTRWPQEGRAGTLAGQDHPGSDPVRPLLHRAQPRPSRRVATRRIPRRPASARRSGIPCRAASGQPEVVMGTRGSAAAQVDKSPWHCPTTCSTRGRCRWFCTARSSRSSASR